MVKPAIGRDLLCRKVTFNFTNATLDESSEFQLCLLDYADEQPEGSTLNIVYAQLLGCGESPNTYA